MILFATETPDYRLVCWSNTATNLEVTVEPKANHKAICQYVWDGLRQAMRGLKPTLKDLRIVDESTPESVISAKTSFRANLGRRDTALLVVVGSASGAWVAIAALTFGRDAWGDVVGAGIPGVLAGLLALLWGIFDWGRGRLVWE